MFCYHGNSILLLSITKHGFLSIARKIEMWVAQNHKPSIVSIHLHEYLCHCSCTHGRTGTFKVNTFVHGFHSSTHKRLLPLPGQLPFLLDVLLAWFSKDNRKLIVQFILWCWEYVIQRKGTHSNEFWKRTDLLLDPESVLVEGRGGVGREERWSIAKAYREADGAHSVICFKSDSEMVLLFVMPLQ